MRTPILLAALLAVCCGLAATVVGPSDAWAKGDGDDRPGTERGERILKGLAQGVEALEMLGGQEEQVARLKDLMAHLEQRLRAAKADDRAEDADGDVAARGPDDENRALRRRADVLRLARHAFREAGKEDAAEVLERAIHTAELLVEERRDAEAQEIYARTPSIEDLSELLKVAAKLWTKFGHEDKAGQVARLARYYDERVEARSEPTPSDDRGAEIEELRKQAARLQERLEVLRKRLSSLAK